MTDKKKIKVALVGNPNTGKSSLFNHLTGLNQKVGNYPGITVDKKLGYFQLESGQQIELLDLPGTYSLYPRSRDEEVVIEVLSNPLNENYPDLVMVIADGTNLKRNLLLFSQIRDLGLPVLLIINMIDVLEKSQTEIDLSLLEEDLKAPIVPTNARKGTGIRAIKEKIPQLVSTRSYYPSWRINHPEAKGMTEALKSALGLKNGYLAWQWYAQPNLRKKLTSGKQKRLDEIQEDYPINPQKVISKEVIRRHNKIDKIVDKALAPSAAIQSKKVAEKLDAILLHKVWGYVIMVGILLLIFQAIFSWASGPMDLLDAGFATVSAFIANSLPQNFFTDLLANGVLPGISGILIFIPQIALLFFFIALFEETGYMARVVFLMDKLLRPFGLNGKSVVPLVSGYACAIPAIMATRSIGNWKERLTTILVVPFTTCSARIPVYTILIALIVPSTATLWGVFNTQGLLLMGFYVLGAVTSLVAAFGVKSVLKTKEPSYLMMELPDYKVPRWKNVGITIIEKTKAFVYGAGKVILAISLIIWVLSSFGPSERFYQAEQIIKARQTEPLTPEQFDQKVASYQLENSFIGVVGKTIEPVIKPLGYDWKIGIALLASFAAREVFVGTMATIYSLDNAEESETTIKAMMAKDVYPETGEKKFNLATSFSLLIFYAFAMQCMSTLAIVFRETKSWKWPLLQFIGMTLLAYFAALAVYQALV